MALSSRTGVPVATLQVHAKYVARVGQASGFAGVAPTGKRGNVKNANISFVVTAVLQKHVLTADILMCAGPAEDLHCVSALVRNANI